MAGMLFGCHLPAMASLAFHFFLSLANHLRGHFPRYITLIPPPFNRSLPHSKALGDPVFVDCPLVIIGSLLRPVEADKVAKPPRCMWESVYCNSDGNLSRMEPFHWATAPSLPSIESFPLKALPSDRGHCLGFDETFAFSSL